MMILRQSTAVDVIIGPFLDSTDGDTEETALAISAADVRLSKNGQTMAAKNDATACAHDASGMYNCELDATDTNTVGTLVLYVHESGALAVRHEFQVVEEAIYDKLYASSSSLNDLSAAEVNAECDTAIADASLATAANLAIAQTDLDTITGIDGVTLATVQGNYAPAVAGDVPTATENADALLNRDMSAVSDTNSRSPLNAFRFLRNRYGVSGSTLTVYQEDDTTAAWTSTLATDANADPVTGSDPA